MQRRMQRVFISIKEQTCVSYAKIATLGGLCDANLAIIKATPPDDSPLQDKYVHEFLQVFSISLSSYRAFALSFAWRFSKTKSWRVALKCLLLLHRLLRTLEDHKPLRSELLWARSNGLISLNPCNFRDYSSSASEDYTSFVRSYAMLLDETLDCDFPLISEKGGIVIGKMKDLEKVIAILPQMQGLIDRVIDCRPTGVASRSFLVHSTMRHVVRESFDFYNSFKTDFATVLDSLIQLPYSSCMEVFREYKKSSLQADQLCQFHDWCKNMGFCGLHEYPSIERIPHIQVRALETFLIGMWNLSDRSSSSYVSATHQTTPNALSPTSSSTTYDEDDDRYELTAIREKKGFYYYDNEEDRDIELEPLINRDDSSLGWEKILEASISYGSCMGYSRIQNDWAFEEFSWQGVDNEWKTKSSYINSPNPFYQYEANIYYGLCPATPLHA